MYQMKNKSGINTPHNSSVLPLPLGIGLVIHYLN